MVNFKTAIYRLNKTLSAIDYNQLPISDYNKQYIGRIKPALPYYLEIFATCIKEAQKRQSKKLSELTMVDFGGGSGFLSMLAKQLGMGQVVYVDLNEESVKTISLLKELTGTGPDVILHGSAGTLRAWCEETGTKPELLVATDLIEHIYNLNTFFSELRDVNEAMHMVFTTASTPYNPMVIRRLHKLMKVCEQGENGYRSVREKYIKNSFPRLTPNEVSEWATQTRGLVFADIEKAIKANQPPRLSDPYNTCNPATGNWAERILPIKEYRSLLSAQGYSLAVLKGFYNTRQTNPLKAVVCKILNTAIRGTGSLGFVAAPFILLSCRGKGSNPSL